MRVLGYDWKPVAARDINLTNNTSALSITADGWVQIDEGTLKGTILQTPRLPPEQLRYMVYGSRNDAFVTRHRVKSGNIQFTPATAVARCLLANMLGGCMTDRLASAIEDIKANAETHASGYVLDDAYQEVDDYLKELGIDTGAAAKLSQDHGACSTSELVRDFSVINYVSKFANAGMRASEHAGLRFTKADVRLLVSDDRLAELTEMERDEFY
ncbi:unnamed protein product, partial [Prorocentrum cordatum]